MYNACENCGECQCLSCLLRDSNIYSEAHACNICSYCEDNPVHGCTDFVYEH